ncbi:MAG: hypothetical protein EPN26_03820, partial [Rhodospirillales bacterium]
MDGLDPLPFGANQWDDGAGEIETVWLDEILSASHRLNTTKLLWTAVRLDHSGRSLRLLMAGETNGNGADPDWLDFPAPEIPCWPSSRFELAAGFNDAIGEDEQLAGDGNQNDLRR